MVSNTITRAVRYDWQRESAPLEGQKLEHHKAWLEVWQRVEIQDIHSFPLWEKEVHDVPQNPNLALAPALAPAPPLPLPQTQVHDVLQKRFADLKSIFLAYCRSIGSYPHS